MPRLLILVSSPPKPGQAAAIAAGAAPRRDYLELQALLGARLLAPPATLGGAYRLCHHLGGHSLAQALRAWRRRGDYDLVLTDQEGTGLLLSLLFKLTGTRRGHVMIAHYLSPRKKELFFRILHVQTHIDRTICYSSAQEQVARGRLGLREDEVRLILHPADSRFWRPAATDTERAADATLLREAGLAFPPATPVVASAGLEFRDYPTLIAAAARLPAGTQVVIAAASPWSKRKNTAQGAALPPHVHLVSLAPLQLRALYRRAGVVALPLYDVDFQAGSLVAYEALACGRPVVISRTRGQHDIVRAEETGRYVPPDDVAALAAALADLLADPARAEAMGRRGRAGVESGLNLDTYLAQMGLVIAQVAGRRLGPEAAPESVAPVALPPVTS